MVGRRNNSSRRTIRRDPDVSNHQEPDIYGQMLAEAGVSAADETSHGRPLKRRKAVSQQDDKSTSVDPTKKDLTKSQMITAVSSDSEDDEDENVEFEDVVLPAPNAQMMELESDDESDEEEDLQFEDVDFSAPLPTTTLEAEQNGSLELNLSAHKATDSPKKHGERRRPISKQERELRLDVHKTHLLCLLSHAARRNHWCNDGKVQGCLRPHLTDKMIDYLNPGPHLPQFGQAESLKNGLKQACEVWKTKFEIKERGLRRALWAEDSGDLQDYEPPGNLDSCLDRDDFREAAKSLQGSRDVGAQLFCALLRSTGARARLVCSLQPLSFSASGPTLPKPKQSKPSSSTTPKRSTKEAVAQYAALAASADATSGSTSASTARRRLGHPNASAFDFRPRPAVPSSQRTFETPVRLRESAYPIYWVEVLDTGHQKWQPVDPVVTHSFWRTKVLEPPITDRENVLSYVVAFEHDGTARDVTRRYAKAYTAKTRRLRVETAGDDGGDWWGKVMGQFRKQRLTDLDQIEDIELAGLEAREPMPRNVQDFKDHPVYALKRHMRRHEVLVPEAKPSGTVAAGVRGQLEKIYRRKDVRIARSADKWYRMGREVKPNEIPAKWLQRKAVRPKGGRLGNEADMDEDAAGTPIYTVDQTEIYEPPPVRNGRVPKNKFGNIDAYVPSMIPKGAVHIDDELAARAAFIAGVDYAPALAGFDFKGRRGTAVFNGIVVATEFKDAIRAVLDGMADVEQEMENERKRMTSLRLWRRLLMGLRIRERIWSGVDEEEEKRKEAEQEAEHEAELANAESDVTEEFDMIVDDADDVDGGGGFLID